MAGVTFHGHTNSRFTSQMDPMSSTKPSEKTTRRSELLAYLRSTVRENGDFIHFPNKLTLFKELHHILGDDAWQVRHECVQLIGQLIPMCGPDLDSCLDLVLVRLVRNLGHEKILVRRSTVHTLHSYMKQSGNLQRVFHAIVTYGLENEEKDASQEYTMFCLPMLLTSEFDGQNFFLLVQSLARVLLTSTDEKKQAALIAMEKVRQVVGKMRFDEYLAKLHPRMAKEFQLLSNSGDNNNNSTNDDDINTNNVNKSPLIKDSSSDEGDVEDEGEDDEENDDDVDDRHDSQSNRSNEIENEADSFEFGILPVNLVNKLNNQDNWEIRYDGVEFLRQIVLSLNDVSLVVPHLPNFIALLNRLVSDVNFKIASTTLEIYKLFIDKVKYRIRPHLYLVVNCLSKYLADSKLTIRSSCIRALMQLMQCVSPMPIIAVLLGNLQHKSCRLREETINLITSALLTFPSYEFDVITLCTAVAPMILDPKRKIRQCVLECLATLAQSLGPTRSAILMEIIENLQREHRGTLIVAAVHARLARKVLPRVNSDGLLEYSVDVSSSNRKPMVFVTRGADIDWILAGVGTVLVGSASSRTTSTDREVSSGTSKASFSESPPLARRIVSPGRGKTRLPWDDVKERPMRGRTLSDDNVYVKGKASPTTETHKMGRSTASANNYPRKADMETSLNQIHYVPNGSLQKQMYLQKLRQRSDKYGEKVYNNFNMSILPDKPKALIDNEEYINGRRSRNVPLGDMNNMSSTWPLQQQITPTPTPPLSHRRRKILDPIQGPQDKLKGDLSFDDTPVPTKPTIIRTSSAHKHRKVPPIGHADAKENGDKTAWTNQTNSSTSSRSSSQNTVEDTDRRNWKRDNHPVLNEILIDANTSKKGDKRYSYANDIPFKSKPVLVRSPSLSKLRSNSASSTNDNNSSFDEEVIPTCKSTMASTHTSIISNKHISLPSHDSPIGVADVRLQSASVDTKSLGPDQFSSDFDRSAAPTPSDDDAEDEHVMSQTARDRILFKKQQLFREAEKKRLEKKNTHIENLILPTDEELEEIVTTPKKSPAVSNKQIKSSPISRKLNLNSPALSHKSNTLSASGKKPIVEPEAALRDALHSLNNSEWANKCEGAQLVSRLAVSHPEVLLNDLHNLTVVLLREVQNLRSSVSRVAILAFGELFSGLKRNMETQDLDNVCKVLLHKSGESNKFIQDDVEKALLSMVESINPTRAAVAIIQGGASHKNASVRKLTSQLLAQVASKVGPAKLLNAKELTDKIVPTAAHFVTDSSPFTRYYGRLLFHMIIFQPQFESVLQKTVQANVIRNIRNVLDGIKTKGVGDKPTVRV